MKVIRTTAESVLDEDGQDLAAVLAVAIMRLGGTAVFSEEDFEQDLVLGFDIQYMREHPDSIKLEARKEPSGGEG